MKRHTVDMPSLIEQLRAMADDPDTGRLARSLVLRLEHPMQDILAAIPGGSAAAKARAIGCARQTYFAWRSGRYRPQGAHARTIARLAGRTLSEVEGLAGRWERSSRGAE